jgi:phosphoribosylformimino-5-aminoimidazole carboxamide ribotide isomerase
MPKRKRSKQSVVSEANDLALNTGRTAVSLAVASALAGAPAFTNVAYAQDSNEDVIEEIVTIGVRMSILDSVSTKRSNDVVSDVVDAGALGALPDQSIADSLGRVPGVTTVRESGQSSQLNIRGMNGDFIQTTLNGREQASTSSYTESTRWVSFDQYPAELITQAAVYKSPMASHIEGGVAGIVNLKTANPLDAPKEHNVVATARLSRNSTAGDIGGDEDGYRYSLSYQGKFADDTLGIAVGISALEQPNAFTMGRAGADSQLGYDQGNDWNDDGSNDARPRAFQWQAGTGTDERIGALATLVWQPTDSIKAQVDYFRSDFERGDERHGVTVGGMTNAANLDLSNATVVNGIVTGASITPVDVTAGGDSTPWVEARTEDQSTQADSESIGLNLEWHVSDASTLSFDYSTSTGDKTRKDRIVTMHDYTFTNGGADWQETTPTFTYALNGLNNPTGTVSGVDLASPTSMYVGRYEEYPHEYTDEVDAFKVDFAQDVEWGAVNSVEVGYRYSEREAASKRGTFLYGTRHGQWSGEDCNRNMTTDPVVTCAPLPVDGFVTVQSVPGGPDHVVVTNMQGMAEAVFGPGNFDGKQVWSDNWTFIESGSVKEKIDALYAQANFEFEWGSVPVRGNFGVRYVETDVKASGLQQVGNGLGVPITDDLGVTNSDYAPVTYGPDYSDTLPSLNLAFELTDNDIIRFAAAKVLGRPPVAQLKGGAGSWNSTNQAGETEYNVWTKGSPYLDPFRATQIDLSYEHYFDDGGAVTAAVFWKDIDTLVEKVFNSPGTVDFDDLGIEIPDGQVAGAFETYVNNDKGGYIRGVELAVTKTFDTLPGVFSGLGATASYSYTESEMEISGGNFYGQNLSIPGLSKNVWSATVFYDYEGFSAHVNTRYRDDFIVNMAIPGSSTPALSKEYMTVDAQVSYLFDNNISIVLSGNNLTDEPNQVEYGVSGALGEYRSFGRQYYLGINWTY